MTSSIFSHWQASTGTEKASNPHLPVRCSPVWGELGSRGEQHTLPLPSLPDLGEGVKSDLKPAEIYAKTTDGLWSLEPDTVLLVGCQ